MTVESVELLADGFFVDDGEELADEVGRYAYCGSFAHSPLYQFAVAVGLHHRKRVHLFELPDFARDSHTPRQHTHQFVVDTVDLAAQLLQVPVAVGFLRNLQAGKDFPQLRRGNLLRAVAQRSIGQRMHLDNQAVEASLKRLTGNRFHQVAAPADMTRIAQQLQATPHAPAQLHRYLPLRGIAVKAVAVDTESAVDGGNAPYTCIVEPLYGANP